MYVNDPPRPIRLEQGEPCSHNNKREPFRPFLRGLTSVGLGSKSPSWLWSSHDYRMSKISKSICRGGKVDEVDPGSALYRLSAPLFPFLPFPNPPPAQAPPLRAPAPPLVLSSSRDPLLGGVAMLDFVGEEITLMSLNIRFEKLERLLL